MLRSRRLDGRPSYARMNSVTQRSPVPTMRRTLKRFVFGCATREAWILCRPLMRSPDCGYSSSASSRYMSCSTSKSFASEAAQWRLSASRISFSSILLLPFLALRPGRTAPSHVDPHVNPIANALAKTASDGQHALPEQRPRGLALLCAYRSRDSLAIIAFAFLGPGPTPDRADVLAPQRRVSGGYASPLAPASIAASGAIQSKPMS